MALLKGADPTKLAELREYRTTVDDVEHDDATGDRVLVDGQWWPMAGWQAVEPGPDVEWLRTMLARHAAPVPNSAGLLEDEDGAPYPEAVQVVWQDLVHHAALLHAYRRETRAWSNGVADLADEFLGTYNREAACGPADLLPALEDVAELLRAVRTAHERYRAALEAREHGGGLAAGDLSDAIAAVVGRMAPR